MKHSQSFTLMVSASVRSLSDENWALTEPLHVELWNSAAHLLRERTIVLENLTCKVMMDWTPLAQRYGRHYQAMKYLHEDYPAKFDERIRKARFPRRASKVPIIVVADAKDTGRSQAVAASVINDVFLIMNIAAPGSCNFSRARLAREDGENDVEISLSNYLFEEHLTSGKWPFARSVDLQKVISWYYLVRQGVAQLPSNDIERALFALLHLAKLDGDAVSVVWLFYALESLLQTRVGENFSATVRRLSLLLDANVEQSGIIKRELRKLYDVRSAIVHGGFEVLHLMMHSLLDKRTDDAFGKLLGMMEFGHAALIAAMQKLVESGRIELRFDEVIAG